MRHLFSALLLASAFAAVPATAYADQIDDFVLTGDGHTFTFSFPESGYYIYRMRACCFDTQATNGVVDGTGPYPVYATVIGSSQLDIDFLVPGSSPGNEPFHFMFYGGHNFFIHLENGPGPFSTNFPLSASFVPGSYPLFGTTPYLNNSPSHSYTLTITPEAATSLTPEPATLALLATGSLGLLTSLRRRRLNH